MLLKWGKVFFFCLNEIFLVVSLAFFLDCSMEWLVGGVDDEGAFRRWYSAAFLCLMMCSALVKEFIESRVTSLYYTH